MALIATISEGYPWPSLQQYLEGTRGPHCTNIRGALTTLHSHNIQRAFPVHILCMQPATHLLSGSTPVVLEVVMHKNLHPP